MRKSRLAALLAAAMLLALGGCGKTENLKVGFVAENADSTEGAVGQIASGISTYASEKGAQAKSYSVKDGTEDAYSKAFDDAADDDMNIVVTVSGNAAVPLYKAQKAHKDTKYIMFNGKPKKDADSGESIRKNTVCVTFDPTDEGFLAGYAAVKNGYTNIGFLSGKKTARSEKYRKGYIAGAEYAGEEEGMSNGSVVVMTVYAGTDRLMPLRATEAMIWYETGCDFIVTDKPSLAPAILTAANGESDKYCGFLGFIPVTSLSTDRVLFSSAPNYTDAVQSLIASAAAGGKSFKGGTTVDCGFEEGAIALHCDFSKMSSFTEDLYNNFLSTAKTGLSSSGAASAENASARVVTVSEQEPVDPATLAERSTTEADSSATAAEDGSGSSDEEEENLETEEASSTFS